MRPIPTLMQNIMDAGGPFLGDNKAQTRITVDPGWWLTASTGAVGNRPASKLPIRWWQDDANSQFSSEIEIPNLKQVIIDRQLQQVSGTIQVELYNTYTPTLGTAGPNPDVFGDPGYYAYARGSNTNANTRWGFTANSWHNLLRENALLRVYQGYGGQNLSIADAVAAGNLILDGVFLVDNVQIEAQTGLITMNGRDMGKLAVDQYAWPPTVPQSFYTSAGIVYFITGQDGTTGNTNWVILPTALVATDRGNWDPSHPPQAMNDGSLSTYWLSPSYSTPSACTWGIWYCPENINGVYMDSELSGVHCYVSIQNSSGAWINSSPVTPDGVPYVYEFGVASGNHYYRFPANYAAWRVRLTFSNLQPFQTDVPHTDTTYVVVHGDNLSSIAAAHGISLAEIEALNPWIPATTGSWNLIYAGMVLKISETTYTAGTGTYTVVSGDNLWDIALAHGMTVYQLEDMNTWIAEGAINPLDGSQRGSGNYNLIYPGYVLRISTGVGGGGAPFGGYHAAFDNIQFAWQNSITEIAGNYRDYADIVADFLLWSGHWLKPHTGSVAANASPKVFGNVESTGAWNTVGPIPADTFDKLQISDCITAIAQVVGYIYRYDETGAARFESPNWWSPGNFLDDGTFVSSWPILDEKINLNDYTQTTTDSSMVSEIIVAPEDPYLFGGSPGSGLPGQYNTVTRFTPSGIGSLHGINKPAMIGVPLNVPVSAQSQEILAELLALQCFLANRQGQAIAFHNPAICVNDQIKIYERTSAEANIHYVTGVHIEHDLDAGNKLATYTTYWMGNNDTWVIDSTHNSLLAGSESSNTTYNDNGTVISQQLIDFLANTGAKSTRTLRPGTSGYIGNNYPTPPAAGLVVP